MAELGCIAKLLKNKRKKVVTEEGCFGWRGTIQLSQHSFRAAGRCNRRVN